MSEEDVKYVGKPVSAEMMLRSVVEAIQKRDTLQQEVTDATNDANVLIHEVQKQFKSGYYVVNGHIVSVDSAADAVHPVSVYLINETAFDDTPFF